MNKNVSPVTSAEIECTFTLRIKDDVFRPGRVRVHLPAPINADWLFMGQILSSSPAFRMVSIEDHPQRSVWFDEILEKNTEFSVTYAFESAPEKISPDIEELNKTPQPGQKIEPAVIKKFEESDHCDCGSYTGPSANNVTVMDLVSETGITRMPTSEVSRILGLTPEELEKAKKKPGDLIKRIFDTCAGSGLACTSLENCGQGEPREKNGIMSRNEILVALMRSCGIPARWQGGFRIAHTEKTIKDAKTNNPETKDAEIKDVENKGAKTEIKNQTTGVVVPADWAIVNAAPYGWIYMDAQAAHEALEAGNSELAAFYFGGIDALRIPTAAKTAAGLYPARDYKRSDERYNLFGEVEFEERGLEAGEYSTTVQMNFK
ncbi:MAG: transglutaminase-like domain-containing protein [Lachnospiraceae bacterium]|nr:transglutaminase-like domain-containing protein [Lachnospiraceae bacterium]